MRKDNFRAHQLMQKFDDWWMADQFGYRVAPALGLVVVGLGLAVVLSLHRQLSGRRLQPRNVVGVEYIGKNREALDFEMVDLLAAGKGSEIGFIDFHEVDFFARVDFHRCGLQLVFLRYKPAHKMGNPVTAHNRDCSPYDFQPDKTGPCANCRCCAMRG